jgi:hypothetical protein
MGVTPFPQPVNLPQGEIMKAKSNEPDWVGLAVGGTFLAGALLLLCGKKKAGLGVTAGAMVLTALDQQESIREWWYTLPKYLDHAQQILDQAQGTIEDLAAKRDKLRAMFNR